MKGRLMAKYRDCRACDHRKRITSGNHYAVGVCGQPGYGHVHRDKDFLTDLAVRPGTSQWCVAIGGSCGSGVRHYVSVSISADMTVKALDVQSRKESWAGDRQSLLPELPEFEPDPAGHFMVRRYRAAEGDVAEKWVTVLKATPTLGHWDEDVHPGWTVYPAGSPGISVESPDYGNGYFRPSSAGCYVVSARLNYDESKNLKAQARTIALYVVDPKADLSLDTDYVELLPDGSYHVAYEPCADMPPIPVTFGGTRNLLPPGFKAVFTLKAPKNDIYELYEDEECTRKLDRRDEIAVDNESDSKTIYLKVLEPSSPEVLQDDYEMTVKYGKGNDDFQDTVQKTLHVEWSSCEGGKCGSRGGDSSVSRNTSQDKPDPAMARARGARTLSILPESRYTCQKVLGIGPNGRSGGIFTLNTVRNDRSALSREHQSWSIMPASAVKRIGAGDFSEEYLELLKGLPSRICTGVVQSEISYSLAGTGEDLRIEAIAIKQYRSSNLDPEISAENGELLGNTVIRVENTGSEFRLRIDELKIADNGVSQSDYWIISGDARVIPELLDIPVEKITRNGIDTFYATRDYTEDGVDYRQEFECVGDPEYPARKIERKWQYLNDGYVLIYENMDGEVSKYAYYPNGMIKQSVDPMGRVTVYEYDSQGRTVKQSDICGSLTTVNSFAYTAAGTEMTGTVNGVVTRRSRTRNAAGESPAESTVFDENGVAYTTRTWYILDPFGSRTRVPSRQVGYDGQETRYAYELANGSRIATVERGVFGQDTLLQGTRSVSVADGRGNQLSSADYAVDAGLGVEIKTAETVNLTFDADGRPTSTRYLDGSISYRTYGCCGVESETDRDGVTTTYAYDEMKRLSYTVRDGITTLYGYDDAGNQTSVTVKGRENGEITTRNIYSGGRLTATVDALGNRTTHERSCVYETDAATCTETVTNPDGGTQVSIYVNGELTGVSGTAVRPQTYEYGPNWQKTLPQNQTVYTDMLGRQYRTVYADGTASMQYYDAKGQMVKSVTPAGRTTLCEYDALGRRTVQAIDMNANGEIDSADLVTSTAYAYGTESGKIVTVTTTTQSCGAESKVISIQKQSVDGLESWSTDAAGLTTHVKLERLGDGMTRRTVTNPDGGGSVTITQNGRTVSMRNFGSDGADGNLVEYVCDEFNRVSGTVEKNGDAVVNAVTMTYDAAGQILSQTVNGQTTSYARDPVTRTKTTTLPGGRVMVEEYFPGGELKKVSGADTYTQEWTYDPVWGQKATLTTYKDASTPQVTGWTYNNRGFNVAKSYPDGTGPSYSYDADGKLQTRTWARGVVATYAYDAAGRASGVSYSDETPAIAVSYDFLGRAVTITDASGTKNLTYNSNSQLENETIPHIVNLSIQYGYDAYGRQTLRQLKQNDAVHASVFLSYDSRGRTATVGNGADVLHYAYRAGRNQLETAEWKNAQNAVLNSRSYAYDSHHRLTGINLNGTLEVGYTLNDKDRRTGAEYANSGLWNFTYDDKGQVISALGSSRSFAYTYDGIGNRTAATEGGEQFSYASNQLNQYTAVNASQPTYDADGNLLTSGTGWTYTWNGENRLIAAENADTRVEMAYDCMGHRFEKKVYIANTLTKHEKFVYDGYKLTAVYDVLENNALRMTFAWQPDSVDLDVPVSMTCDGETYYYVTDGNKNVTALLDADGVRVAKYTYNPFGRILNSEGALAEINPFRFSSEYHDDETGLVYYNYRYYSPELGRWIKRDPIEEEGGVNLYAMVGNNPVNRWDHLGFSFWDWHKRNIVDPEVRRRIAALTTVFEDRQGILIFLRWALALGDWHDAPFGNYLKHNRNLNIKLREFWSNEFTRRNTMPIGYQIISGSFYAAMENGYTTGYKLLHGVNMDEGGLEYHGILTKTAPNCFSGDFSYTWHDKIDPNFGERGDLIITPIVLGFLAYKPKDYVISINFSGQFKAKLIKGGFYDFEGYPHGNAVEDWF